MTYMFAFARPFNQPIGDWNVDSVTNMSYMFFNAHSFNQPIGDWNVASVTNMMSMFEDAHSFNQRIGDWNVASVTKMSAMFMEALCFYEDLRNWANLMNIDTVSSGFDDCVDESESKLFPCASSVQSCASDANRPNTATTVTSDRDSNGARERLSPSLPL